MEYPFLRPDPPKLSQLGEALAKIERSGIFSNFGPVNQELEDAFIAHLFGGVGHCVTTSNATLGLILAIRHAVERRFGGVGAAGRGKRKYALMPSFTFAATGHAALWNNLVPLLCDIDPETWLPSPSSLEELLDRHADEVAVIVPNATFGNNLDLSAYAALSSRYDVPVVVDAAASLGSIDRDGRQFGAGCVFPTVYSMHVTKTFSAGEAGLIYCKDAETIENLRCMANFGFGQPRSATMLGLNGKLTEVAALLCREKLKDLDAIVERRCRLAEAYRKELPALTFQAMRGPRHAYQFISALLPKDDPRPTAEIVAQLSAAGVTARTYLSPHLAAQAFFRQSSTFFDLPVTEAVAAKIISLPLYDDMTSQDVGAIGERLRAILAHNQLSPRLRQRS
jgi:dTDP-4-amino-4,6-dideoxygalactose transaminase